MTTEEIFQHILTLQAKGDIDGTRQLEIDLRDASIRETGRYEPIYWIRRMREAQRKDQRKDGWFILTGSQGNPIERFTYDDALKLYASELHQPVTLTQYSADGKPWRYMRSRGPQESQWVRLPDGRM